MELISNKFIFISKQDENELKYNVNIYLGDSKLYQ